MIDYNETYDTIANIPGGLTNSGLVDYILSITSEELEQGFVTRYFARQANHSYLDYITEVSRDDYLSLKNNPLYTVVELDWHITGPLDDTPGPNIVNTPTRLITGVITANKLAIQEAEKVLPGLSLRLRHLTAHYQD